MTRQEQAERAAEREEESAHQDYAEGRITQTQLNARVREIQRDYRADMEEASQDAYDREREEW